MGENLPVRPWALLDCRSSVPHAVDAGGTRHWTARTANFVVVLSAVDGHAVLSRDDNPDEYMVVVPPGMQVVARVGKSEIASDGNVLFIVPPGPSELSLSGSGLVTRVFSTRAKDIAARAANGAEYATHPADVMPLADWPAPIGGFKLRHYALAEYENPSHISRIFRSTNLMLNVMKVYNAPRDPHALMPHTHPDDEQITVAVAGRFMHHLRTPWLPDSAHWRDDVHLDVGSPSALVIPSRLIHTTQAMEEGCWLIDVFGPPRMDFSSRPGMVCNADEYPMPTATATG